MQVSIIFHSERLSEQLRQLSDRLQRGESRHIRQGLIDAARAYMAYIKGRFFRASRHDGTWKDHAPSTKLAKLRKHAGGLLKRRQSAARAVSAGIEFEGGRGVRAIDIAAGMQFPILYETGRLFRSLTPGGPGYVERFAGPLTLFVGTAVPYAVYHQFGGPRLPQRTILDVPDARTVKVMDDILSQAVEREVAEVNAQLATA